MDTVVLLLYVHLLGFVFTCAAYAYARGPALVWRDVLRIFVGWPWVLGRIWAKK